MLLQNSYANVVFENKPEEQEKNMKAYGAVAGYIGNSKTYYQMFNQSVYSSGYNYLRSNYYVANESIEYSAYGRVNVIDLTTSQYTLEKIANDTVYFIKCATIDEIPSGVRIYE